MPSKDRQRQRDAVKKHYYNNRQQYIDKAARYRREVVEFINKYKEERPCTDCGIFYPHYVMDFDHMDATQKEGLVSRFVRVKGLPTVFREIEKCELVCANCHRERTFQRSKEIQDVRKEADPQMKLFDMLP